MTRRRSLLTLQWLEACAAARDEAPLYRRGAGAPVGRSATRGAPFGRWGLRQVLLRPAASPIEAQASPTGRRTAQKMKNTRTASRIANKGTTIGIQLTKPSPLRSGSSPARLSAVRSGNRAVDVRVGRGRSRIGPFHGFHSGRGTS